MKKAIDRILDSVKDPESGLPVSRLGLVKKIRYAEKERFLYVFTDVQSHQPGCMACRGISMLLTAGIFCDLESEFRKAFPHLTVEFIRQ